MNNQQERFTLYLENSDIAIGTLKEKGYAFVNSDILYQSLVYQTGRDDVPTDLINEMLSVDKMIVLFEEFITQNGIIIAEIRFDIQEPGYQPADLIEKATLKADGNVWRIHKNDADPFPSKPHAHLVGSPLKLHLGTGEFYKRKQYVDKLPTKKLLQLREKIKEKIDISLPPLEV